MFKIVGLIFLAQVLDTAGQIFFKKGAAVFESLDTVNWRNYLASMGSVLRLPAIWTGFAFMAAGLVTWLAALAGSDLSKAIPISSVQYLLVIGSSAFFLRERICGKKLIGTLLITAGILLISIS